MYPLHPSAEGLGPSLPTGQARDSMEAPSIPFVTSVPSSLAPFPVSSEQLANCTALACQHHCVPTLSGPACYCNNSFQLAEDRRSCKGWYRVALPSPHHDAMRPKGLGADPAVRDGALLP